MKGSIVFIANGFDKENCRLQPWRYVYELARYRLNSHKVYVIAEGATEMEVQEWDDGMLVIKTNCLSVLRQSKLKDLIVSLNPLELWWSTTPRTIAYIPILNAIVCTRVAFITCPIYEWRELLKAAFARIPFVQTRALWTQRVVPRFLFKWMLRSGLFSKIIVQSPKNHRILLTLGVPDTKLALLPVGIDKNDILPVDVTVQAEIENKHADIKTKMKYLYFGAARPIRGFDALIKALPQLVKRNSDVILMLLARGASEQQCKEIELKLSQLGVENNVEVIGGWLTREQVWAYIEFSDAAVLPFVLVPSDIPIAVLEAMARGKPVVVSGVDGLPDMVDGRGMVADPLNTADFSDMLYQLSIDDNKRSKLGASAKKYMESYPTWDDVGEQALSLLSDK